MWKMTDKHPPLPPIALDTTKLEEPVPKALRQRKPPCRTRQSVFGTHISARGGGRGSKGGRGAVGGRSGSGRGAVGGRGASANRGPHLMDEDEIRVSLEHDYMQ
ncbi:hypothetical protein Tco_0435637 [Tanacetum coccineum]